MELNKWVEMAHDNAVKHGFCEKLKTIREYADEIIGEVEEMVQANAYGLPMIYVKDGKPEGVAVEAIDVLLRTFTMLGELGVDVEETMAIKHAYNTQRPYLHGKE